MNRTDRIRSAKCRALRHQFDDNGMFQEQHDKGVVWVVRLVCTNCGTWRIDVMQPHTCQLLTRDYDHPENYDKSMTPAEARQLFFSDIMARSYPRDKTVRVG